MIYSDMWCLEINPDNPEDYSIFCMDFEYRKIVLTNSLGEFIARFFKGGVFEIGGLYAWADEIKAKLYGNTDPNEIKPLLWVYCECLKRGLRTKEDIVWKADWIIATEDEPDHFFIEMSLSHDLNGLIAVLDSINFNDDISQVRAFFCVIDEKLLIGQISVTHIISILEDYSHDDRFTPYERGKMIDLITDSKYLNRIIGRKRRNQKLIQDIKSFFNNYQKFYLHHPKSWEKTNAELIKKFEGEGV